MTRYIAIIYALLYVLIALHLAAKPDPQERGPFSFPNLKTNYLNGAP